MVKPGRSLNAQEAVSYRISRLIITLHEDGYIYDFYLLHDLKICCAQACSTHSFEEITINRIGLCGHNPQKMLIAVETNCGLKGMLITVLSVECFDLLKKEGLLSKQRLINEPKLQLM